MPVLEAPDGRRDDFIDPYFKRAKPDQVVAILRAREPGRILIANGNKKDDRWHLQITQRWVIHYNFYVNDARWGRMFVRMCPYFPFSARVCLNQHHWLANRMREEKIDFQQCSNAFLKCSDPKRLQELADSLSPKDLLTCGQKWLACFTPFFTENERKNHGCQHRLFFAQVEYCDNLVFHRRAALDALGQRLLDANRNIGQPNKITTIFGRKVTKHYRGELKTVIEDIDLPSPVIRSHYGNGFIKQYVRDHLNLRTEPATNNVADYGVKKAVENLPELRQTMAAITDNYLDVQQDTFWRPSWTAGSFEGWPSQRSSPTASEYPVSSWTILGNSRSCTPWFALPNIAARNQFSTRDLHEPAMEALGVASDNYSLASLRYDLSKLRAKGLLYKVPRTRRYKLTRQGYSICVVFLKLFERIYAPLTTGLLQSVAGDSKLQRQRRTQLDGLYQRVADDLDELLSFVGLKVAA